MLQKFRGELQMLDARGQGGRRRLFRRCGRGSDFGQTSPTEAYSGNRGGSGGGGARGSRELDDEIPF